MKLVDDENEVIQTNLESKIKKDIREIFENLCKDYNDADMAIFINQVREIKSIMAQIKLDGGEP